MRSLPQPFAGFVSLHSAPSPFTPLLHAAAGTQHVLFTHAVPGSELQFALQVTVTPAGRHEFCSGAHAPASWPVHVGVGVQHVPAVPAGGAFAGAPVPLLTQNSPFGHAGFRLLTPHPLASEVPH
jgi:hypothetical protein